MSPTQVGSVDAPFTVSTAHYVESRQPTPFQGLINRPAGVDVQTMLEVEFSLVFPWSEIPTNIVFYCHYGAALPAFCTKGAPTQKTLNIIWSDRSQFVGFDAFSGSIGEGRIYIRTTKGIIMKGEIEGGPEEGQSFTGGGTWLMG